MKFWTDNICINPNMKDVVKMYLGWKSQESHGAHILLESQVSNVFKALIELVIESACIKI
jgi:hypothetical protein